MSIFEYDQEKHMRQEREEAWEEGRAAGIRDGLQIAMAVLKLSREGKSAEEIAAECEITEEEVKEILG